MPKKVQITIWGYRCERCGREWVPRGASLPPKVCPSCKSPYWDRARRRPQPAAVEGE